MSDLELLKCTDSKIEALKKINAMIKKSGSSSYIGQTIFSLDPLYEDTLHLADGSLLLVGGIYDQFISDYIAKLYVTNPERFCTEEEYQTSLTNYGVCGKYVYNEGVSVRLPKLGNYLYSDSLGTVPVKGNGMTLGITDGSANYGFVQAASGVDRVGSVNTYGQPTGTTPAGDSSTWSKSIGITTDGTKSGIIADLSDIQVLEGYYYIVVASGSKTDIEVNLDNFAVDLNGKADVDLSNINPSQSAKNQIISWNMPNYNAVTTLTKANGTVPFDGYLFVLNTEDKSITFTIGNVVFQLDGSYFNQTNIFVPVQKGQSYSCSNWTQLNVFSICPLKGAN